MFFIDYERFYGIKSYYNKNSINTRISEYNTAEIVYDDSEEDFENHNEEHSGSSKLLGSLKSKSGNLIAGSAAFIKSGAVSDKINAIGNSIKKSSSAIGERASDLNDTESLIEILESESGNIDFVIDKYIEAAGYMPAWKFERFCNNRFNFDCDSAISKYRIKVFTFYMRDLIPVITKLYKFNFLKLYDLMTDYQAFFTTEADTIDRNLLLKASLPIINKMVSGGMLNVNGEGFEAVYQSNAVEKPLEEEELPEKEADVKPKKPIIEYEEEPDYQEEMQYENEIEESPAPVTVQPKTRSRISENSECSINSTYVPQSAAFDYEYAEKNNRVLSMLIIILIIVLIMIITIGIINLYRNNGKSNDFQTGAAVEYSETSASSTILTTSETEINTTVTTEAIFKKKPIVDKDITDKAFGKFLGEKYNELIVSDEYNMGNFSKNEFAVYDIDNDGSEELLLIISSSFSAKNLLYIYKYESNGIVTEQYSVYSWFVLYENGSIKEYDMYNPSLSSKFQPYTLHKYIEATDSYLSYGHVEAWDKNQFNKDNNGKIYPEERDISNTGFVYYINAEGFPKNLPFDVTIYEEWNKSCIGNGKEINLDYFSFNPENIRRYDPSYEYIVNTKGNYLGSGYVHVDSGGLNLRSKPSTDSDVYIVIPNNASVTVYSSDTYGWYYVEYGNYKGYVSAEFITFTSPDISGNYNGNNGYSNENNNTSSTEYNSGYSNAKINLTLFNDLPIESYNFEYSTKELIASYSIDDIRYTCTRVENYSSYNIKLDIYGKKTYDKYNDNIKNTVKFDLRVFQIMENGLKPVGGIKIEPFADYVGDSYCISENICGYDSSHDFYRGGNSFETDEEYVMIILPEMGDYINWKEYTEILGLTVVK